MTTLQVSFKKILRSFFALILLTDLPRFCFIFEGIFEGIFLTLLLYVDQNNVL